MTVGLVGKKCGMTRVFAEDGTSIPVTVIEAQPNKIEIKINAIRMNILSIKWKSLQKTLFNRCQ